ncbi:MULTISPECIES: HigA family addiction module antitoxin [Gammaproteobacteria]|jgi:addiction module HigA family antidote|uniref:Addiction module antidote protein, HigA family n=2 Tax=Gammaproteobacteria TaxID=1236 RepID=A0A2K9UZ97_VIBAL|nr:MULTISPECIES: HigA family addiction module antitoxin [Gammaproteobacteria]HCE3569223.1 HigA family addiction module antidote protein [Vibrio parahaemolyticus]AUV50354.1 addiction module antidote protein, HigA family [Vibrio alginolyticus]AWX05535.1 addiction module antidote protein, HigA family [Enterobacter hormaechei]MBX6780027.1 HigA family addiction module antidote protein [Pseudomonas aeruginosa]MDW3058849.1 HigA family addiction module antitoxin [Vibrio sp. 1978]
MNMKRKPKAPGEVLETQFMQPNQITQKELASHTGWTRKHVNELCKGKARVTIDTALILGKAFGTGPDYWLELQQAVDIWDALHSEKRKERLESIVPLMKMVAA